MKQTFTILVLICCTLTAWGQVPRPEYPRPQFERSDWVNLNGSWSYTFDFGNSGKERNLQESQGFDDKIIVPFCPESKLSGVEHKDFINNMWYQRKITIPADWKGKNVLLNFGAVYYLAEVYIDGKFVGRHFGGTISFQFDITPFVTPGKEHNLVVYVNDNLRSGKLPSGKQCFRFYNETCMYTRTTGIWQTVWMEAVSPNGLKSTRVETDIDQQQVVIYPTFFNESSSNKLKVTLKDNGTVVSEKTITTSNNSVCVLPVERVKTWAPEHPFLYDLTYEVLDKDNNVIDKINSYTGMRKISIEGNRIFLNNQPYYLRLVLDQGFYPDGVWTAPSDADLKKDIELSQEAGFNGARLHQKVFEERFHYWADKLGYLTWGEFSSWGSDFNNIEAARNFISEWTEVVLRDRNYSSIIAWTPFNESWDNNSIDQYPRFVQDIYKVTKGIDPTRPMNDASGGSHVITDIYTVHNYEQDPAKLSEVLTPDANGKLFSNDNYRFAQYQGQPYIIDEFGGIKWIPTEKDKNSDISWGYGEPPKTLEQYYSRLEGQVNAILSHPTVWGYCFTQLTDVQQEQNGIYLFSRAKKFDMDRIHKIFSKNPTFK